MEICTGGACQVTSCSPGYGDCNGDPSDGCEVLLATSAAWTAARAGTRARRPTGPRSARAAPARSRRATWASPTATGARATAARRTSSPAPRARASCGQRVSGRRQRAAALRRRHLRLHVQRGLRRLRRRPDQRLRGALGDERPRQLRRLRAGLLSGQRDRGVRGRRVQGHGVQRAGFGDCDGNPADGCEAPLDTITNCGALRPRAPRRSTPRPRAPAAPACWSARRASQIATASPRTAARPTLLDQQDQLRRVRAGVPRRQTPA